MLLQTKPVCVISPPNQTLYSQQQHCLIFSGCFPDPLPISRRVKGAAAKAVSPMTPAAGDAGAPGSDHKNRESSNLRLQIIFIL